MRQDKKVTLHKNEKKVRKTFRCNFPNNSAAAKAAYKTDRSGPKKKKKRSFGRDGTNMIRMNGWKKPLLGSRCKSLVFCSLRWDCHPLCELPLKLQPQNGGGGWPKMKGLVFTNFHRKSKQMRKREREREREIIASAIENGLYQALGGVGDHHNTWF